MNDMQEKLIQKILSCDNIAVFSGAGMSTASGIPDFRGNGGLYTKPNKIPYETLLSIDFFYAHPEEFYEYLRAELIHPEAKPNIGHIVLGKLEPERVKAVVTQNIDSLHQKGGSKNVLEIHGTLADFHCSKCHRHYTQEEIMAGDTVPYCESCGALVRPDIVFYGEGLDNDKVVKSINAIESCDLLIVLGSSLVVYPAAGFVRYIKQGAELAIINRDPTDYDSMANYSIHGDMTEFFCELNKRI